GGEHIRGFDKDPRTEIRVLVDIDNDVAEARADKVAKLQGKRPDVVTDIRDCFDMDGVDIVTAATPNHWHALMGVWAMQAGKDVYIEKPISHNVSEGRALVDVAKQTGRMFQTGTQCRSSTGIIPAMNFIQEGGIGQCRFARGLCYKRRKSIGPLGDYDIPSDVNFDLWSGPATFTDPKLTRQRFHYDWHWQRHYGNGDSGNQGPHQTDIARWGLGLDRHPSAVLTYGGRLGYQAERDDPNYIDAGDTANTQVSIYDYGDKCIVFETRGLSVDQSGDEEINALFGSKQKGNKIGVIFYGSEGYVVQGPSYSRAAAFDLNRNLTREFKADSSVGDDHFRNFIDCVLSRDGSSLHADANCGHLSAAIAHLGNTSYYVGQENKASTSEIRDALAQIKSLDDDAATLDRTIQHLVDNKVDLDATPLSLGPMLEFDGQAERFTNHDAANDHLTRTYRDGFELPKPTAVASS
ncbi:MAG: Gfo/Idh/MocA family oxidoreductase, partial [Planctomycetota bacterium]